jgi:hypothetical protein
MARILLAPIFDQNLLGAGHHVASCLNAGQSCTYDAAVRGCSRRTRAGIRRRARRPPLRRRTRVAEYVVVGVEDVNVGVRGEVRREREPEETAVPEVVDVRPQVCEHSRRRVRQAVEDLDQPALLGNEDTTVRGETDNSRIRQPAQDDRLLKAGRGRSCAGRWSAECRDENRRGEGPRKEHSNTA